MEDHQGLAVVLVVAVIDEASMSVEVAVVVGERGLECRERRRGMFSIW